jgi:hypothetical protein
MKRRTAGFLLLSVLVVLGQSHAWADPVPVDFSYQWTFRPSAVLTGGDGTSGSVTFAVAPSGSISTVVGADSPVSIFGANVTTNASNEQPDFFNTDFSVDLKLTEGDQSGLVTFSGTVLGFLTWSESTLQALFHEPTTQQLTLGNHLYTVTIDPITVDVPAPGLSQASLSARISVTDLSSTTDIGTTGNNDVHDTPEPSSLLLGATALLGGFAYRRWRRNRRA